MLLRLHFADLVTWLVTHASAPSGGLLRASEGRVLCTQRVEHGGAVVRRRHSIFEHSSDEPQSHAASPALLMLNSTVIRFSFLVNQTEATETTGGEGGDIRVHDTAA